jgi:hypothetical protein
MARKLRLEYAGAVDHVMARGEPREEYLRRPGSPGGDDHAAGLDSGASADGQWRLPDLAPAPARQAGLEYDNTIN